MQQPTFKATKRVIDSVWTIQYRVHGEKQVEILSFDRNDDDGYLNEKNLPKGDLIESDDGRRTVVGAIIAGIEYSVVNPKYVFSYTNQDK